MTRTKNPLGLMIFTERSAYDNLQNIKCASGSFVPPLETCIRGMIKGDFLLALAHWHKHFPEAYEGKISEFNSAISKGDCHMSRKEFLAFHDNYAEIASVKHNYKDPSESKVLDDYFHLCHLIESKYINAHPFTGSLALILHKTKSLDGRS